MKQFIFITLNLIFLFQIKISAQTVVEINDSTLESVYYHQTNFPEPTTLVFTNLRSVEGYLYFHQNHNLVRVEFPLLESTGSYFYFSGNTDLESIIANNLVSVTEYIYICGNTSLTELQICNLEEILPYEEILPMPNPMLPYSFIENNTSSVDNSQPCWQSTTPENIQISNSIITENSEIESFVGTLTVTSENSKEVLTYYLTENPELDNERFIIRSDSLFTAQVFDYESSPELIIEIGVFNQYGDYTTSQFIISVKNVSSEELAIVEISDTTLENVFYHMVSFDTPTKLIFTNLTSVKGHVYFHQNTNLAAVEFPNLKSTGEYFYFSENLSLVSIQAPILTTVYEYIYINGNTSLEQLDICNIEEILPVQETVELITPYHHIRNNSSFIDSTQPCWETSEITNLLLSQNTISENLEADIEIGRLTAESNNEEDTFTYYLTLNPETDNESCYIEGNTLRTAQTFDFETQDSLYLEVGVINQIGESLVKSFIVLITDVAIEDTTTIEITDTTLASLMYHQISFTGPTKLIFTNLESIDDILYFHNNINLVSVEFPQLTDVNGYVYFSGNQSLEIISAPLLESINDYLYVCNNSNLMEFNICSLNEITQTNTMLDPYYYIVNNPELDYSTTCLIETEIIYTETNTNSTNENGDLLLGSFSSSQDDDYSLVYYFSNDKGEEIANEDLIIENNNLYLSNTYSGSESTLSVAIGAIRYETLSDSYFKSGNNIPGVNEKIMITFEISLTPEVTNSVDKNIDEIQISPNPVQNNLILKGFDLGNIKQIKIIDTQGKIVYKDQFPKDQIDVSNLTTGLYALKIYTENKIIQLNFVKK